MRIFESPVLWILVQKEQVNKMCYCTRKMLQMTQNEIRK